MAFVMLPALWPLYLVALSTLYAAYLVVYRRYLHPLADIPGPFLWAVSGLPILYHQALREGRLMHELPRLHEIYGPVVRIGPNEVHLSDPANFDKIFNVGSKFLKDPGFYGPMEGPIKTPVILTVISPDVHRVRRAPLSPFFSRRSVVELEQVIWGKVHKMRELIHANLERNSGQRFDAYNAIRAFSVDVVTEYSYARCWNHLDDKDFGAWYQESIRNVQLIFIWLQTFPFLIPIFGLIPDWVQATIFPFYKEWLHSLEVVRDAVDEVRREVTKGNRPPRRTIFHELMDVRLSSESGGKQQESLSDVIIFADAVNITGAAAETTGSTVERAVFEVMYNPDIYQALTKELRTAYPNPEDMTFTGLEKIPYLAGVIKEALRLNSGVPGRAPRVVPVGGATFNGRTLPEGTVVSMSASMIHSNEEVFPNPKVFDPHRWIGPPELVRARERCLVSFSRGTRNCVGQNLALCELYCLVGSLFHHFDDLQVAPEFGPQDMELIELLIGYHPRSANKFKFMKRVM